VQELNGGYKVIVLKTIDLRNDFKKVSDLVMSGEKVLISRPRNENLVVLSESEYRELEKGRQNNMYQAMTGDSALQVAEATATKAYEVKDVVPQIDVNSFSSSDEMNRSSSLAKFPRSSLKGILKGKVWMSEDFDEPMEEMEEYM